MVVSVTSHKSFSILIVEDHVSTNKIISKTVAQQFPCAATFSAENGKEGLKLFIRHRPDIVITDISMPQMDGLEMTTKIKSIAPDTTFIVFTAHTEGESLREFHALGIYNYLMKPLLLKELLSAITECLKAKGMPPVLSATRD